MAIRDADTSTNSTVVIDCDFTMPRFAAAYLLISKGEAAFIDNNTRHCVPKLLRTLEEQGLAANDVKYVIITHVHLDHAGGTGDLMDACPNAQLLAHPKATRHMIDPSRLINAVRQVYGDAVYEATYAPLRPVAAERVRAMQDEETARLGERTLRFIHTRGHANHHMCIFDETMKEIFTGDAFGIAYPDLQKGKLLIYPTTTPTEYDGELARQAIDRIVATKAEVAYLTHYGPVNDIAGGAAILKSDLHECDRILETARQYSSEAEISEYCKLEMRKFLEQKLKAAGQAWTFEAEKILSLDIDLNGAGLACRAIARDSSDSKS